MSRRFQFSLDRLFFVTTVAAVIAAAWPLLIRFFFGAESRGTTAMFHGSLCLVFKLAIYCGWLGKR